MSGKSFLSHALGTDQETGRQTNSPPLFEKKTIILSHLYIFVSGYA